jgi:APA family basic amino acid/polyamine antiporter
MSIHIPTLLFVGVVVSGIGALFSMWVTLAAGYQSVYQALILVLAGVILHAFVGSRALPAPAPKTTGQERS